MTVTKEIDLRDFAANVERLCDFFLDKTERDGSEDRKVLENLKEDAADIQFNRVKVLSVDPFVGLQKYMQGV